MFLQCYSFYCPLYPFHLANSFYVLICVHSWSSLCVHRGFPFSPFSDSSPLLSPQLCFAQSSYAQRCVNSISFVGRVQKLLSKIRATLCKKVLRSTETYRMLIPQHHGQCSCSFVQIGGTTPIHCPLFNIAVATGLTVNVNRVRKVLKYTPYAVFLLYHTESRSDPKLYGV